MTDYRIYGVIKEINQARKKGVIKDQFGREHYFWNVRIVNYSKLSEGMAVSFLAIPNRKRNGIEDIKEIWHETKLPDKPSADPYLLALRYYQKEKKPHETLGLKPQKQQIDKIYRETPSEAAEDITRRLMQERKEKEIKKLQDDSQRKAAQMAEIQSAAREALRLKRQRQEEDVTKPDVIVRNYKTGLSTGSQLASYIQQMASEVKQTINEEGWEINNIYSYEEPDQSTNVPQSIQIDPRVAKAFRDVSNINKFYSHQIQTRNALLKGKNVIISTPTASGKTEAYNPTIIEELINNPNSTALYMFPLVALGFDQTERLQKLNCALPDQDRLIIGILNNNVPGETKSKTLRADNRILVTTPETLHYILLPKRYPNWQTFYRNLRYIVIDEAHVYRGVFGANMANIIRRLLVRCRREGNLSFPKIIISSATIRRPSNLAYQLTGLPEKEFEVITESGASKPGKHFLITRSDIHDLDSICIDLLNTSIRNNVEKISRPISIIIFLRSINEVKQTVRQLREYLHKTGNRDKAEMIEEFYSDKTGKLNVLTRLQSGEIRCVFTTTALMAGIDIGSLDVVIVKNFPGLVMDARQMFGRAGRIREGAAIFIANRNDPFDQFYFEKPELLFQGPTEDVVANPENPILLAAHLLCAAQVEAQYNREGPLSGDFVNLFGTMGKDILDQFVKKKMLSFRENSYYLKSSAIDPHDLEPLDKIRTMSSENYSLLNVNGQLLEEKRIETAFRDAHRDAIIWVNGHNYKVIGFDTKTREIICESLIVSDARTKGVENKTVEIKSIDLIGNSEHLPLKNNITFQRGEIEISIRIDTYMVYKNKPVMQCRNRLCRHETPDMDVRRCSVCNSSVRTKNKEEVVDQYAIPTPPTLDRRLKTRSAWLNFPAATRVQFSNEFWPRWSGQNRTRKEGNSPYPNFESAIHSVEHAILKSIPEFFRCDHDEIAGVYQLNSDSQLDRLFIYDNFPGGLGLSDEFVNDGQMIIEGALDILERCTCLDDEGCPVCLAYFGCHNFNQLLSKLAGRYLLRILLGKSNISVLEELQEYVNIHIPANQRVLKSPDK